MGLILIIEDSSEERRIPMNKESRNVKFIIAALAGLVILSLLIAACGQSQISEAPTKPPIAASTKPPTKNPTELPTAMPVPTYTPASTRPLSGLGPNPQRVEFKAEDGKNLLGYYYPSKYADAPIMILMHWAGGDLCDWKEIAPWLQNRLDENPAKINRCAKVGTSTSWWDPTWFPPMNADVSIAVFAFDFRGYGESGAGGAGPAWVMDAKAAFETAAGFDGVDATRMASMGASIGADGSPDGCLVYNQKAGRGCVGALSLSPGSYFHMDYGTVVHDLAPVPVWCLAGELDSLSFNACRYTSGKNYRSEIYLDTNAHGMVLLSPDLDPQPMKRIQEFIELVFGESVQPE